MTKLEELHQKLTEAEARREACIRNRVEAEKEDSLAFSEVCLAKSAYVKEKYVHLIGKTFSREKKYNEEQGKAGVFGINDQGYIFFTLLKKDGTPGKNTDCIYSSDFNSFQNGWKQED